jgi:hypothetical protein
MLDGITLELRIDPCAEDRGDALGALADLLIAMDDGDGEPLADGGETQTKEN